MTSVLGLPRLKNQSQKIIACRLQKGFKPLAGQAVSAVSDDDNKQLLVIPFNGDFFGIVAEIRINPERCSVVRAGLSVPVRKDDIVIDPNDITYFNESNGYLTDSNGVGVNARIKSLNERVYDGLGGELLNEAGALIDLNQASTVSTQPVIPDFNQLDFLAGDFA